MEIVKIGIVGMVGVLLAIQFKSNKPEYSYLIGFGICLFIFLTSLRYIANLLEQINGLQGLFKDNYGYFKILLKVIGITYICEFCSGVCSDSGYKSIANQIEVFGKISILLSGMPILLSLIHTIQQFAGGS